MPGAGADEAGVGSVGPRLLESLLAALDRAEVHERPFAHVILRGAIPPDLFAELRALLPATEVYLPDNPKKYGRPDGSVARVLLPLDGQGLSSLPERSRSAWGGVAAALASPELKERVFRLLARDLSRRFRVPPGRFDAIEAHPRPSLVRDFPGYWIEPHPDTRAKVVTLQLYLPSAGSPADLGTSFYRLRPWRFPRTGRFLEEFRRAPFEPGSGYAFAVGPFSWHGVERIREGSGPRDSILLFYFRDPGRRS
ncbi:MAG: hypothetical protein U0529_04635 [Thermoanaerobaculia bacterium]